MSSYLQQILADAPAGFWPMAAASAVDVIAGRNLTWTGPPTTGVGPAALGSSVFDGVTYYGYSPSAPTALSAARAKAHYESGLRSGLVSG